MFDFLIRVVVTVVLMIQSRTKLIDTVMGEWKATAIEIINASVPTIIVAVFGVCVLLLFLVLCILIRQDMIGLQSQVSGDVGGKVETVEVVSGVLQGAIPFFWEARVNF